MKASVRKFIETGIALTVVTILFLVVAGSLQAVDISKLRVGDEVAVTLSRGGTVEGTVVAVDSDSVTVKHRFGRQKISKTNIQDVEKRKTPREVYDELAKTTTTADAWFELARKMAVMNDPDLEEKALQKALKIDPDHAATREALGHVKHEGEWMPEEDAMEAKGLERYQGEWMTPEEIQAAKEKERAELAKVKLKGREAIEREYEGRPWADITPVRTEHYEIWCNSTQEVAEGYGPIMEALHEKYSSVFQNFKPYKKGKGVIRIHRNHQQFMDWTGNGPFTGGFCTISTSDVTAYHGSFGTTGTTYEVLAHEGTHQFQLSILKDFRACPMWVIEGLAVFFGDGSEYDKGKVEIGLIPRDRLEQLQRNIETGSYPPLDTTLTRPMPFPGFFYAHAWGVCFWCLRGNKTKPKVHNGEGIDAFAEFLVKICESEGFCDYAKEAARFKGLLEQKTGTDIGTWEEEYKEWIMKLPLEKLMRKKRGRWVSEKLGFSVKGPSGWKTDRSLRSGEEIAFLAPGKHRRISSAVWSNSDHAELSAALAQRIIQGAFIDISYDADDTCMELTERFEIQDYVHGLPAVEAVFHAKPRLRQEQSAGGDAEEAAGDDTVRKYRVVIYASLDRIRANVLECEPAAFREANLKHFDRYLESFKIDN